MRQQSSADAAVSAAPRPADCTAAVASPPAAPPAAPPAKRKLPQSFAKSAAEPAPSRSREEMAQLPLLDFRAHGRMVYAGTAAEAEAAMARLPPRLPQVGWDIEWKATFKAGEPPRPPALMQICFREPAAAGSGFVCLLLHICHTGLGPRLRAFLTDPAVAKAGVNARLDAHKVRQDLGVEVAGVVELTQHPVVHAELPHPGQSRSLASLTAHYLRCSLSKGGPRTGDWERRPLTSEQLTYAATDALASLQVLQALQARPQPPPPAPAPAPQLPEGPLLGCEAAVRVPALPQVERLQPSKLATHELLAQGLSLCQAAAQRGIQPSTAASYLAEAVLAGHAYLWPPPGLPLPADAPAAAAGLLAQLLPADWRAAGQDLETQLREAGTDLTLLREMLGLEAADLGCVRLLLAHVWRQRAAPG